MLKLVAPIAMLAALVSPVQATPQTDLERFSPALAALQAEYPEQVLQLQAYARSQDFTEPHEQLAIVSHELIHVASAAHDGYWINGTIYEGYQSQLWKGISAGDVTPSPDERNQMAPILNNYWERNPSNDLGRVIDEINAYGETTAFVCLYARERASRQTGPLIGHLTLLNAWLRAFRTNAPDQYARLKTTNTTRGIIGLTVNQAWHALASCGVQQIRHQDEVQLFLN
ncbi:hypothetical protein [Burkholderia sp. LMG 13014]|uniref:hypothetical protein n=1 Tax=Burkholderia sp. LMG 13014 TaxID=2709306 RepID=UPI0019641600|nr:hypothetical protein [Burkholderia sp. LMG 13014]